MNRSQNANAAANDANSGQLVIDDRDRYERLKMIGWWEQSCLRGARVIVVGAGALGNEVLKNLALLGVGHILVFDFETVEISNLSRSVLFRESHTGLAKATVAAEMCRELNPDCQINGRCGNVLTDVGLGLVRDADVVIGCVDNREARLWINRMCWKVGTPWIDGGIQEINGVAKVFVPPDGACYECAMTENDYRLIQLRYSCPLLRREEMQQGKVPTAPTIASLIGALQVQEAVKLLHGLPTAEGSALVFNGLANRFYQTRFPRRDDCLSHETYEQPLESNLSATENSLAELFAFVAETTKLAPLQIELDRDFVPKFTCQKCSRVVHMDRPIERISQVDARCVKCGETMRPEIIHLIENGDQRENSLLSELGIPAYDIVKVQCTDRMVYVALSGDRDNSWRHQPCRDSKSGADTVRIPIGN